MSNAAETLLTPPTGSEPDHAPASPAKTRASAFDAAGLRATVEQLENEIRELYQSDNAPWIVGYSGGKDSTATLQLIWNAIAQLSASRRCKPIYVITTDTLVENPIVSAWVNKSLQVMREASREQGMPIDARMLTPKLRDRFWVNLIGRGYPAPRPKFRWCTERLKIKPSNEFISNVVDKNGEAVLCLGARRTESVARARVFDNTRRFRMRDRFSPSETLPGCMIYTPVETWTNDDIWIFLNIRSNPWGLNNKELMGLYAGASPDGECPLVVDDSTPSCGDSRFGCWVCTLVEKDKSMTAMIQNDSDKEWMRPLLDLRNELDARNQGEKAPKASDHDLRDFRRMTGAIQIMSNGDPVPGPYKQGAREQWLFKLLKAEAEVRKRGPAEVQDLDLIPLEELQEIRRIWVMDKHELEDSLPSIYKQATGKPYPGGALDDNLSLGAEEMAELRDICGDDRLHFELARELISITRKDRNSARRANLNKRIEQAFKRHYFDDKEEAIEQARQKARARDQAKGTREPEVRTEAAR
ncbi:putative sulfurtransferase DndC [Thioflavicoccus mobilis 8321]|uniref:Putative sulfurtransferase DndC n=1 Tax=Thioflavicoccus mobilis 8321 TaxID=765912 RepID=L0GXC5_9GAMM|nr:DNA phosphorothioation system sulfurtransferase DndC [Thioflavicoccus mobilis]AGA91423.1 putative sulfurtransferase DndC [Thioflavicoccus mobilis 8321]